MVIPGNYYRQKLYKLSFEKKKFRFPKGVSGSVVKSKTTILGCLTEFSFFGKKKLIKVFFGVEFTGDYRDVAIIPTLFPDHRQK